MTWEADPILAAPRLPGPGTCPSTQARQLSSPWGWLQPPLRVTAASSPAAHPRPSFPSTFNSKKHFLTLRGPHWWHPGSETWEDLPCHPHQLVVALKAGFPCPTGRVRLQVLGPQKGARSCRHPSPLGLHWHQTGSPRRSPVDRLPFPSTAFLVGTHPPWCRLPAQAGPPAAALAPFHRLCDEGYFPQCPVKPLWTGSTCGLSQTTLPRATPPTGILPQPRPPWVQTPPPDGRATFVRVGLDALSFLLWWESQLCMRVY